MPKESKKESKKGAQAKEIEKEAKDTKEVQKTSIQISTIVRDRLWRLKFRKTYDEFLLELCEMYEKASKSE